MRTRMLSFSGPCLTVSTSTEIPVLEIHIACPATPGAQAAAITYVRVAIGASDFSPKG